MDQNLKINSNKNQNQNQNQNQNLNQNENQYNRNISNYKYRRIRKVSSSKNDLIDIQIQNSNSNFSNSYIRPNLIQNLSENNIIFKHMMYLISEQDYKFKQIHNKNDLEDYIKNLDNTPVYITYNCGILYVPNKGKILFNL